MLKSLLYNKEKNSNFNKILRLIDSTINKNRKMKKQSNNPITNLKIVRLLIRH